MINPERFTQIRESFQYSAVELLVQVGPTDQCTWEYTGHGLQITCGRNDEVRLSFKCHNINPYHHNHHRYGVTITTTPKPC